jgi:hypothetical protein
MPISSFLLDVFLLSHEVPVIAVVLSPCQFFLMTPAPSDWKISAIGEEFSVAGEARPSPPQEEEPGADALGATPRG